MSIVAPRSITVQPEASPTTRELYRAARANRPQSVRRPEAKRSACEWCGGVFEVGKRRHGSVRKFCQPRCRMASWRAAHGEAR